VKSFFSIFAISLLFPPLFFFFYLPHYSTRREFRHKFFPQLRLTSSLFLPVREGASSCFFQLSSGPPSFAPPPPDFGILPLIPSLWRGCPFSSANMSTESSGKNRTYFDFYATVRFLDDVSLSLTLSSLFPVHRPTRPSGDSNPPPLLHLTRDVLRRRYLFEKLSSPVFSASPPLSHCGRSWRFFILLIFL